MARAFPSMKRTDKWGGMLRGVIARAGLPGRIVKSLGQFGVLWGVYFGCARLVDWLGWPIPANVLGVVVLFVLRCLGVVRLEHVEGVADFLLRHLVFSFVPIAVGLMDWGEVFARDGAVLLAAILVSSLLPLLAVGFLTLFLHRAR